MTNMTEQLSNTAVPTRRHRDRPRSWPVPAAMVALSAIPLAAGTLRLLQLSGGPALIPADHRFTGFPGALVAHIAGAAVFALVGAFQFVPRLRQRGWHRRAGRIVAVAGLVVAVSALWLTLFYEPQPGSGTILFVLRLIFAPAMATCLVLGFNAIRRRDIASHRAWMMRAYAIVLGAGTQAFTQGIGQGVFGHGVLVADLSRGAAWGINLAVAEWAIRRPGRQRQGRRSPQARRSPAAA
jgi:uncharacterized membrane protein YozB (DUF420 family)